MGDRLTDEVARDAAAGVPGALSLTYQELAPLVRGYLAGRGCEDPDAVTNDVFVQVIPRLPAITGGARGLRTFVFSVAHARLVDDHRRRARRPAMLSYDREYDDRVAGSAEEEYAELSWIQASLSVLNADQRSVLLMRVVGDLSIEETARAIGRSAGAVKQLQRRALLILRAALGDESVGLVGGASDGVPDEDAGKALA